VVDGNNQFAFDLYDELAHDRDGNLLFSPYSISTALAMTYAGARGNTAAEMAEVLHFTLPHQRLHPAFGQIIADLNDAEREGYELSVANRLWGQRGLNFLPEFLATTRDQYQAPLEQLDFARNTEQARQTINGWVEGQTHDRIKDLIPEGALNRLTRLVLTNAIYFKGDWEHQFDEDLTEPSPFMVTPDEELSVPMMHQTNRFGYAALPECQILEMPYAGEDLSMVAVLPNEMDGLAELEEWLTPETLDDSIDQLQTRDVSVFMPKFEMTSDCKLADLLVSMGMPEAFSDCADFSGMTGRKDLKISNVLHKAFMELNEEGTEAAAATAVIVETTSASVSPLPPIPVFRADHPFAFFLRDNLTGSILFMGRVVEPGADPSQSAPEPSSRALLSLGAVALGIYARRRRTRRHANRATRPVR
jgi:serpin B